MEVIIRKTEQPVWITIDGVRLAGDLTVPANAPGIVLFAHGSGSSRLSPRNRFVAQALREACLATLLFDLLTVREEEEDEVDANLRFDIGLLTRRLTAVTDWVRRQDILKSLKLGYFGASTGAAAALSAAAQRPDDIDAIVSRGGRPDLAGAALEQVLAPTLLIVGGRDEVVLDLNRRAYERLHVEKKLAVVPGATHLFEEPGALEAVGQLAADWFRTYLGQEKTAKAESAADQP